jgi:hypothetical protein
MFFYQETDNGYVYLRPSTNKPMNIGNEFEEQLLITRREKEIKRNEEREKETTNGEFPEANAYCLAGLCRCTWWS